MAPVRELRRGSNPVAAARSTKFVRRRLRACGRRDGRAPGDRRSGTRQLSRSRQRRPRSTRRPARHRAVRTRISWSARKVLISRRTTQPYAAAAPAIRSASRLSGRSNSAQAGGRSSAAPYAANAYAATTIRRPGRASDRPRFDAGRLQCSARAARPASIHGAGSGGPMFAPPAAPVARRRHLSRNMHRSPSAGSHARPEYHAHRTGESGAVPQRSSRALGPAVR